MKTQNLTIMFTDIKGFTQRTSGASREGLHDLLSRHEKLLTPVVKKFGGRIVKTIGDAFLVVFESPTNAVLSGILIQEALRDYNISMPENERIMVRISLNSGEVELRDGDVFGEAVNIAARIEGITEANEIYFTESVYLAMNKSEVPSSEVGYRLLKGIPHEIKVYRVIQDHQSIDFKELITRLRETESRPGATRKKYLAAISAIIMVLACSIFYWWSGTSGRVLSGIQSALTQDNLPLAKARSSTMAARFPGDPSTIRACNLVLHAETAKLCREKRFTEAMELISRSRNEHSWLDTSDAEKKVLLFQAAFPLESGDLSTSERRFAEVLARYPEDREVWQAIVKSIGGVYNNNVFTTAFEAANKLAQSDPDPDPKIGEIIFHGLLNSMSSYSVNSEQIQILKHKFPETANIAKRFLCHNRFRIRTNAAVLKNAISPSDTVEALEMHFFNLTHLTGTGRMDTDDDDADLETGVIPVEEDIYWLNLALEFIDAASDHPEWQEWKNRARISGFKMIPSLLAENDTVEIVFELLIKAFPVETRSALPAWLTDTINLPVRCSALWLMPFVGTVETFDADVFHEQSMCETLAGYFPESYAVLFEMALEHFKAKLNGAEREKALRILKKAISSLDRHIAYSSTAEGVEDSLAFSIPMMMEFKNSIEVLIGN
ncbi:MAG: adenylate/guanylate cyclase domain-containing protein [Candidatus Wallbacteria bacterium]|nr:adenylate/guanylate cyclase domain-containing protein [Candidatus Wallbacteria bacterium]